MNSQTHFTHTQACTLIAHEAVVMLDMVDTEMLKCVEEFRTALEALCAAHDLGQDGEALLTWVDTEIENAKRFLADGTNLPNMIDMWTLNTGPDAIAQMELVWLLFDTAAARDCEPEQRQALLNTARSITEICGLDDLLLTALRPDVGKLAEGLDNELVNIHAELKASTKLSHSSAASQTPSCL